MKYLGAVDQGTTSSRFVVFDEKMSIVAVHQMEHKQYTPLPGWLGHNAEEIYQNCATCIDKAVEKLFQKDPSARISAVGITNQRETTVAWDRHTGRQLCNAVVWCDMRTQEVVSEIVAANGGNVNLLTETCGLPFSTYFSALKMVWMLRNEDAVRKAHDEDRLCFGTIESWLIYKFSGGKQHVTDCTNASRTMLMNLKTLSWDESACRLFGIKPSALPRIISCSEVIATIQGTKLHGTPIAGCIGDQQSALFGQMCFKEGTAKNTYGTGCFLLANVGKQIKYSKNGLLATVAYKVGNGPCHYALEGSVAGAGSTSQWLRDKMGFFHEWGDSVKLANTVQDTGGIVFVPAFSGLLAPHWRPDARGTIVGMTLATSKAHIVRAAFEAIAHQCDEVIKAMERDAGIDFKSLNVDGGGVKNAIIMQAQADLSQCPLLIPKMMETTALGAALCAGLAVGVYRDLDHLTAVGEEVRVVRKVVPKMGEKERKERVEKWKKGLERALNWTSKL